mgnify:FL=1
MNDDTQAYRVPGRRLGWAMAYAKEQGIAVLHVQPDGQGGYIVTVRMPEAEPDGDTDAGAGARSLAPVVDAPVSSRQRQQRKQAIGKTLRGIGTGMLMIAIGAAALGPATTMLGLGVGAGFAGMAVGVTAGAAILLPAIIIAVVVAAVALPTAAQGIHKAKERWHGK